MRDSTCRRLEKTVHLLFMATLASVLVLQGQAVSAAPSVPVDLGTASTFAVLTKAGVSNVPNTSITGNVGVSPIAATGITGFSLVVDSSGSFSRSTQVVGKVYAANYASPTPANLTTAVSNMETAYTDAAGRSSPDFTELYTGDLSGRTLAPGLYKWSTDVLVTTNVTLAGTPDDVWIFQIAGDLTMGPGASVFLTGGASPKNIFWQVAGGAGVEIATTAHVEGNLLAQKAVHMRTGASLNGRVLAQTALTLDHNTILIPPSNGPCGRRVLDDFDGDGKSDLVLFQPTTGTWFVMRSSDGMTTPLVYGDANSFTVAADYDGDGKADIASYEASNRNWYTRLSSNDADTVVNFGGASVTPVPSDYDGDGKADRAFFRNNTGTWVITGSATGNITKLAYGDSTSTPVPADYDGDCKSDIAIYHASNRNWYTHLSSNDTDTVINFGGANVTPVPRDYDGDGTADRAFFRNSTGMWVIMGSATGITAKLQYGDSTSTPVPADYDGDGKSDIAIYDQANGLWHIHQSSTGTDRVVSFGGPGYFAVN